MHICYVDESGDVTPLPAPPNPIGNNFQPVMVLGGIFVDVSRLERLTFDFMQVKSRFFPNLSTSRNYLDGILAEVKGADLRRNVTRGDRAQQRQAVGFLDNIVGLLQTHDVRLVARVWIKGIGMPFDGTAVYTSSIQNIYTYFDHYLGQKPDFGMCIADSRAHMLNV